jgi:ABC-type Fe3+/spermidine/putrescine transport system ATPase subunit
MRQGHLIQSGTPEQLYRQPMDAAAARFFSDTNEVKGRVAGAVVETPLGAFSVPKQVRSPDTLVLIRPQGIKRTEAATGTEGSGHGNPVPGRSRQMHVYLHGDRGTADGAHRLPPCTPAGRGVLVPDRPGTCFRL